MDLDRRKHDVDIVERVLGGIRDARRSDVETRVLDLDVPWASGVDHPTLELTVGIDDSASDRRRRR